MKKNLVKWIIPVLILLNSCKDDDIIPVGPSISPAKGLYVLSEGNFNANNTRLGFYNLADSSFIGNYFIAQNPSATDIGDTGNDGIIYGGKLYIVVNGTSNVTVLNANTGTLIQRIPFVTAGIPKSPRYAHAANGKLFVSAYDNTVSVIDTASLTITKTIPVGANPEAMAHVGNFLYVANSGAYNFPNLDSTVSVIDLTTMTEIKKIKVGINPNKVEASSNGDVYVSAFGNFGSIPASVTVINTTTNTLKSTLGPGFAYSHVRIFNDIAYFYNNYGGAGTSKVYNTTTNAVVRNEFITDGTVVTNPYGINIDELNGDVYITDAVNFSSAGRVFCFSKEGKKKFSFSVAPGVSPNTVMFKR